MDSTLIDCAKIAETTNTTIEFVKSCVDRISPRVGSHAEQALEAVRTKKSLTILQTLNTLHAVTNRSIEELTEALSINKKDLITETITNAKGVIAHMTTFVDTISTLRRNIISYVVENNLDMSNFSGLNDDDIEDKEKFTKRRDFNGEYGDIDSDKKNEEFATEYKNLVATYLLNNKALLDSKLVLPMQIEKRRAGFNYIPRGMEKTSGEVDGMRAILIYSDKFKDKFLEGRSVTGADYIVDAFTD